jgi:hypothetical protein
VRVTDSLDAVARPILRALGVQQKGRSRTWIGDRGWWLIVLEFQPSIRGSGAYLNVGEQHLWSERDHLAFEEFERPLGGSNLLTFDDTAIEKLVRAAKGAVERRMADHGEGVAALTRLSGLLDDLNGGVAAALLGDVELARTRLSGTVHPSDRSTAEQYLRSLTDRSTDDLARHFVGRSRAALRLGDAAAFWTA